VNVVGFYTRWGEVILGGGAYIRRFMVIYLLVNCDNMFSRLANWNGQVCVQSWV
jgi:hypothetical protein